MSDPNQPSTPAGWYPDGQGGQRWWDGTQWTEHTQPGGGQAAPPAQPTPPKAPGADLPTQVAPNRSADYPPAGQPGGGTPGQPGAYGAPAQAGYPAPQQQPYGAPQGAGQYGQPGGGQYGQPGAGQPGQPPFGQGYVGSTGGGGNGKKLALIGGGVAALVLLVVVAFLVLGALTGGGPEDVADDYLNAQADGDFEEVCELSSKRHQEEDLFAGLDGADDCGSFADAAEEQSGGDESLEDVFGDLEISYEVGDSEEDGDEATVDYTYSIEYTGDDEEFGDFVEAEDQEAELQLVKEDGDWKVDADNGGM